MSRTPEYKPIWWSTRSSKALLRERRSGRCDEPTVIAFPLLPFVRIRPATFLPNLAGFVIYCANFMLKLLAGSANSPTPLRKSRKERLMPSPSSGARCYDAGFMLKPPLAAISSRLFCPARERPPARRHLHRELRSSPSCHTTDARHRRAHPQAR